VRKNPRGRGTRAENSPLRKLVENGEEMPAVGLVDRLCIAAAAVNLSRRNAGLRGRWKGVSEREFVRAGCRCRRGEERRDAPRRAGMRARLLRRTWRPPRHTRRPVQPPLAGAAWRREPQARREEQVSCRIADSEARRGVSMSMSRERTHKHLHRFVAEPQCASRTTSLSLESVHHPPFLPFASCSEPPFS
jgi:hypothetical protein